MPITREIDNVSLSIGDKAPYFSLPATDGKIYSLIDFENASALAVIFTCNHCPQAKASEPAIIDLIRNFTDKNVNFVMICANDGESYPQDNFENMLNKSKSLGFPCPYLHDENQEVARAYDAACTPEAYLFDGSQKLVYHGRINDITPEGSRSDRHFLGDAITAVLSGEPIEVPSVPAIGCSIKWK